MANKRLAAGFQSFSLKRKHEITICPRVIIFCQIDLTELAKQQTYIHICLSLSFFFINLKRNKSGYVQLFAHRFYKNAISWAWERNWLHFTREFIPPARNDWLQFGGCLEIKVNHRIFIRYPRCLLASMVKSQGHAAHNFHRKTLYTKTFSRQIVS